MTALFHAGLNAWHRSWPASTPIPRGSSATSSPPRSRSPSSRSAAFASTTATAARPDPGGPPARRATPRGREGDADLDDLVARDQVGRQVLEDGVELVGALGRVVVAAGGLGDRVQRVLVDGAPEARRRHRRSHRHRRTPPPKPPLPGSAGSPPMNCWPHCVLPAPRVGRAEPDRVDADPAGRGLLRRVDRLRPGVARPVGQQHDDGRRVGAAWDRRRRGVPAGDRPRVTARRDARVDLGDRVDRLEDRAADRRPAPGRQAAR